MTVGLLLHHSELFVRAPRRWLRAAAKRWSIRDAADLCRTRRRYRCGAAGAVRGVGAERGKAAGAALPAERDIRSRAGAVRLGALPMALTDTRRYPRPPSLRCAGKWSQRSSSTMPPWRDCGRYRRRLSQSAKACSSSSAVSPSGAARFARPASISADLDSNDQTCGSPVRPRTTRR